MASAPLNLVRATKPRQPSSPPARRRLGEILRDRGLISEQQLDEALRAGRKESQRLGEVLCANGVLKPGGLIAALETQWRLRRLDLTTMAPRPTAIGTDRRTAVPAHCDDAMAPGRRGHRDRYRRSFRL